MTKRSLSGAVLFLVVVSLASRASADGFMVTIEPADPLPAVPVVTVDAVSLSPLPGFVEAKRVSSRNVAPSPVPTPTRTSPPPEPEKRTTVRF
ncbi:hypothetical protein [Roseibium sp. RKSG952]|uniref:hypothetical protein n=1 Tax=Roseibium sp. RKSG952 TaxID=2529384 RepID=UPI0012BC3AA3|nr:hypothetical protein [Roseibium sp. RKSG952]MTH95020.1 hypothetical protein [Roseibium sp. RKSG952]